MTKPDHILRRQRWADDRRFAVVSHQTALCKRSTNADGEPYDEYSFLGSALAVMADDREVPWQKQPEAPGHTVAYDVPNHVEIIADYYAVNPGVLQALHASATTGGTPAADLHRIVATLPQHPAA